MSSKRVRDTAVRDGSRRMRWDYIPGGELETFVSPKEKAMAPHSSTLAWKFPWMEEPGGLQSMGSLRVGHD